MTERVLIEDMRSGIDTAVSLGVIFETGRYGKVGNLG